MPEQTPPRRKRHPLIFMLVAGLFGTVLFCGGIFVIGNENRQRQAARDVVVAQPTPVAADLPAPSTATTILGTPIPRPSSTPTIQARCTAEVLQEGRSEPRYVGMRGYLAGMPHGDAYNALPEYPWSIPIYRQAGPELWEPSADTLPAKTPIQVLSQSLTHEGFGRYTGILQVRNLEDNQEYVINHTNFVPVDYWNCPPHLAIRHSNFVAQVRPEAQPIDRDGRWAEMGEELRVFCTGSLGIEGSRYIRQGVECLIYKQYRLGFGGVPHYFSSDDLEIVY